MSNPTSDNKDIKSRAKGPSLRIETAGDIPEERLVKVAAKFAEVNEIEEYRLSIEQRDDLIGGFIVYFQGSRYDYSIKGQLSRIGSFMKQTRSFDAPIDGEFTKAAFTKEEFPSSKIKEDLEDALDRFPESHKISIDNIEIQDLTDVQLDKRIEDAFLFQEHRDEVGKVASISDGVASVTGLKNCMLNELIYFASGATGIAMNLEKTKVGVVLLTGEDTVVESMSCKRTMTTCSVPVGMGLLGRVVDALGHPIDGKGVIRYTEERPVESPAPTIIERAPVDTPLFTGITAIDALTPIGRGQRELIIGDRQTGKTSIALDTIINQKNEDVICVYVPIGQKMANIVATAGLLEKHGAMDYTVIVAASASESAAMQYIAPFAACAIAEKFMYDYHKDVLIVYDDLSKHAQAYRAISLLLRRPPGREAYPGDVFYLHSRLLERSARLSEELGGGSITALPIVETQGNDISFFSGQRPAVNVGLSVSRVGGAAQTKAVKKVAGPLRISLAQAREMASFSQFGSDLDENTQLQIKRGTVLNEVLKQERFSPLTMASEVVLLYCATTDKFNFLATEDIYEFYTELMGQIKISHPNIFEELTDGKVLTDEIRNEIDTAYNEYKEAFLRDHEEYVEDY